MGKMSSLKTIKICVVAEQFVSMKSVTTADTDREAAVVKWLSSACEARVGRGVGCWGGGGC